MRGRALLLLVVVLLAVPIAVPALPAASPEEVGLSRERLARIGQMLNGQVEVKSFPGAVALVARKGRVAYFEAVGQLDPKTGSPMSKDAIFRLYSMTKPFTSVAAMMLVEEGRLRLTDPVGTYLPKLLKLDVAVPAPDVNGKPTYTVVPAERPVTVYDLMRHTSGLVYGGFTRNEYVKEQYAKENVGWLGVTADEQIQALAKVPLAHQPGTMWEYSLSTDVVGRVVESITGTTLGRFLDERLFRPLGMKDTTFLVPPDKVKRLAQPLAADRATGKPIVLHDDGRAEERRGRRRRRRDRDGLRALPPDAGERRLSRQQVDPRCADRPSHDRGSPRRDQARDPAPSAGLRLWAGVRDPPRGRPERRRRLRRRVQLGRRGRHDVLGGSAGAAGRRPHDPGAARPLAARVPRALPAARLSGHRRLSGPSARG
jgi:CubicO group peptidase (beta-lactamase class C family)